MGFELDHLIKLRALSDLADISDEAFRRGLARMEEDASRASEVVEPIDLFVFRTDRMPGRSG